MSQSDEKIAHEILESLCHSSIVDELEYYKEYIQKDLNLSDETMNRLYNLTVIASLLMPKILPVKIYKGVQVYPKGDDTKTYKGVQVYPKVVCDGNVCRLVKEDEEPEAKAKDEEPEYVVKVDLEKYVNEDDFAPQNKTAISTPEKEVSEVQDAELKPSKHSEEEETSDSSESETETQESEDKSKRKSAEHEVSPVRALKKILRKNEVDYGSVSFDSETNPNALIVKGVPKIHEELMRKCTGQWKGGKKHWIFGNEKLLQYYKKTYNEDD
jgi:hypothetical protein